MSDTSISGSSKANWGKVGEAAAAGAAVGAGIKEIGENGKITKLGDSIAESVANSTGNTQDNAQISKLGKAAAIIGGFSEINPAQVVDEIRNSKGATRDNLLVGFQNKLNKMDTGDLKEVRDYLVKEMASPNNKDDELLGVLAKAVNKEIDSRHGHSIEQIPYIFDKFPSTTFPLEKEHSSSMNKLEKTLGTTPESNMSNDISKMHENEVKKALGKAERDIF